MPVITFLGTASAVPNQDSENTHLVVSTAEDLILIDAPGNPVRRLEQAGFSPQALTGLILTHFHPDHVNGAPLLLMDLWLLGRRHPLPVYGLAEVLERLERNMALYDWETWPNFYPVQFLPVPADEMSLVLETNELIVQASRTQHMIPSLGLRFTSRRSGKWVAYSSDTAPCEQVLHLAQGAELLIHEAAGPANGHASAAQAGEIAQRAAVNRLLLIHYRANEAEQLLKDAQSTFSGTVGLAQDFQRFEF